MMNSPFRPFGSTVAVSATAASSAQTLPADALCLELQNDGNSTCFVRWGASAQTAVTTDYPVLPGQSKIVSCDQGTLSVAAICASGESTTLYVTPGVGF